ncbi:serine hydrolase domain-containing protein [Zobellia nedashkovskayae]|uniref:serine hydrolase domain-containing protein n=1 Tax=Zobellia nedashkovskayae TaxID=2779510 RepID=UPI00188A4525|nr:serine hydrolase domain-containing protein [Zobellia nedashkovskayae]
MKNSTTILLLLLCATISSAQSFNNEKIDSLFTLLEHNDKFMGSIAISENQKTIYTKSIGFADFENGVKSTIATKYRIGSISKIFTATLIFKAIEERKLELNRTIETFFPSIKNANTITISNLLNHSSGIHDFTRDKDYLKWNTSMQTEEKMKERIANGETEFSPNEKNEYSNSNYLLLTFILEKINKKPFSKILNSLIINPTGLKDTYYGSKINITENESFSYKYEGEWKKENETDMSIPQGAGAIVSNPSDLNRFLEQLFLGKIISEKSLKQMKTITNGYGMGIFEFPYDEKVSFGHTGGIDGFTSVSSYFPEEKLSISLTSNGTNYNNNNILLAVLATYFNDEFELPNFDRLELSSEDLDKFLGKYSSEQIPPKIDITKDGSTLFAQATGQGAFPLEPTEESVFTFDQAGVKIVFNPSEKTLILYQGGGEFLFKAE